MGGVLCFDFDEDIVVCLHVLEGGVKDVKIYLFDVLFVFCCVVCWVLLFLLGCFFEDDIVSVTRAMWRMEELKVKVFLGVQVGDVVHVICIERVLVTTTRLMSDHFLR